MAGDFEGAVTFGAADLGKIHLVDPMDGNIYELADEMRAVNEWGDDELKLLPVRDYPLFLVFGEMD
jgi:hypothetical protein